MGSIIGGRKSSRMHRRGAEMIDPGHLLATGGELERTDNRVLSVG